MIGRLSHVALAVPDLATAIAFHRDTFGATVSAPRPLPSQGVTVAFVELPGSLVELIEPLGEGSPLAAFLARNPGGAMHHLCYTVPDIMAAREALRARGIRILGDGTPRPGAHGRPVMFLHPKDCGGVLTEIEEEPAR